MVEDGVVFGASCSKRTAYVNLSNYSSFAVFLFMLLNLSKSLALLLLKQSDPTVTELAGWIPTLVEIGTLVLYRVLNTHSQSHRRSDRNVSTRTRAYLSWSRATLNKNCRRDLFLRIWERLRAFTLVTPPKLQPAARLGLGFQYILYVVFLASFALSSGSQSSTFFTVSNSVRSTFHRPNFCLFSAGSLMYMSLWAVPWKCDLPMS